MATLSLKDKIMAFMQRESYAPMTAEEMIFAIPVKEEPMHEFWDAIMELEKDGYVVKTRFETYGLPEKMGLVAGRFQLSKAAKDSVSSFPTTRERNRTYSFRPVSSTAP